MQASGAQIQSVDPDSIAQELGLAPGDVVEKVNGEKIEDYFDYRYLTSDTELDLQIRKKNGERVIYEIEKDEMEDLGINFCGMLFGHAKSCANKCIFCFIDQLPKGMRESLYFKDDDARLSFLYGNYVTLTNMKESELDKIIRYHISPVNISVHTTNPALRVKMLHNRHADNLMERIERLKNAGITMNMQIVLCRGVNDGAELDRTVSDLTALGTSLASISIVPVGVTRYREGLYPIETFDRESASEVIDQIEAYQRELLKTAGSRVVYLSDEFYLMAERPIPPYEAYEDFPQIENGVGMLADMLHGFEQAVTTAQCHSRERRTVACGEAPYEFLCGLARRLNDQFETNIQVIPIKNEFFGGKVTVSGLLTGQDLVGQLRERELGERVFVTSAMFRADSDVLLDDMTLPQVEAALNVSVVPVDSGGYDFVEKLLAQ